jgi:cobalt-zinc-cadmium efflux system membrane fusion protein
MRKCLFLYLLFLACNSPEPAKEPTAAAPVDSSTVTLTADQIKNAGIVSGRPTTAAVSGTLRLQGTIDVPPQSTVSVSFPLGGYLKRTNLLPGTHVRKGQVLGVLEDMQFIQLQQDYLLAKEQFAFADTEYKRQQVLNASKASSDKVLQQAKANMESLHITMQALARKLELIGIDPLRLTAGNISKTAAILSPINGFVSKVNVNIGKYTAPTDVLFELVDPSDIHLALSVFEKDVHQLSVGQKVVAFNNENPDKQYDAEILLISKDLNEERMATVHCHFKQFDAALVPGMFMNAEVLVNNATALTVSEEAIVRWQNNFYIFEDTGNNTFRMIRVTPGNVHDGQEQFSAPGVSEQTRIVTKNAYALLMKMKNSAEEE